MIKQMDKVFKKYEEDYTFTRYTKTNVAGNQVKTPQTPAVIRCYIHPVSDGEAITYDGRTYRIEEQVKIFGNINVDIIPDDEVVYGSNTYRVIKDSSRTVGNYKKLIAGLIA